MKPRVLDLFSGIGGFALAFEAAGFQTHAFAEIEPYPCKVLAQHWPDIPNLGDVKGINGEDFRGTVDVVCGGFPCQDISTAGKGAGIHGERSGLWFEMLRIIRGSRPAFCLLENVPALRSRGADDVLAGLEEAGYTARPFVVGAVHAGAPHRRQRVWIVAYANGDQHESPSHAERGQAGAQLPTNTPGIGLEGRVNSEPWEGTFAGGRRSANSDQASMADSMRSGSFPPAQAGVYRGEEGPRARHEHVKRRDWWATEPALGRAFDGIPGGMDGNKGEVNDESRNCFTQAMRHLRETNGAEALQRATRGLGMLEAEDVLFAFLREYEAGGRVPREFLASPASPETILRAMRDNCEASGASFGRGSAEQFAREHPNALRVLSRMVASQGATPWDNPLWESAVPRVAPGVSNRSHRIKALGNSIVPQVCYPFAVWIGMQLMGAAQQTPNPQKETP